MKKVSFPAIVTHQGDQVQVEFPDLPDAITKRDSLATAISDSRLAVALVVNDLLTHFEKVPAATPTRRGPGSEPSSRCPANYR